MVWDWGAYVDRLEDGWLKSDEAKTAAADKSPINHDSFVEWAEDTHKSAVTVWNLRPADNVLDDNYLDAVRRFSTASSASAVCGSPASSTRPMAPRVARCDSAALSGI